MAPDDLSHPPPDPDTGPVAATAVTPAAGAACDRIVTAIPWGLAALATVACIAIANWRGNIDEAIFRYIGYAWFVGGDLPYRDALENKPPGIFALWGLVWVLFGDAAVLGRVLAVLVAGVTALGIDAMARRLWSASAANIAGPLFLVAMCSPAVDYCFADTETFGLFFAVCGLSVVWGKLAGPPVELWQAACAGALLGLAVIFKPVFIVESAVLLALLLLSTGDLRRRLTLAATAALVALVPTLVLIVYFHHRGCADEFLSAAFGGQLRSGAVMRFPPALRIRNTVSMLAELSTPALLTPLVLALGGVLQGHAAVGRSPARSTRGALVLPVILLVWALTTLAIPLAQGAGSATHRLKPVLVPVCLLSPGLLAHARAIGGKRLERLLRRCLGWLLALALAASVLVIVRELLAYAVPVPGRTARAAALHRTGARMPGGYSSPREAIFALTGPQDRIWCYPADDLYLGARKLCATRYINEIFLAQPGAQEEVLRSLVGGRARLVLINWSQAEHPPPSVFFNEVDRPAFHTALRPALAHHFEYLGATGPWSIYKFRG